MNSDASQPVVAVVGAGANGGAIAAALARASIDVVAIDPWAAHVEAVRAAGLSVETALESTTTRIDILHVCQVAEPLPSIDLVVIAVKAYDTRWVCELIRPLVRDDTTVVAVQNGMTLDTVADTFGHDRSVGAVIEVAANLTAPATIVQEAPIWLALGGETSIAQERAHRAARVLQAAATVTVVEDIRSAKWMKLVANACELVPSAVLDLPLAEAIQQPGMYEFMLATGREALDVALANGHEIVPIFGEPDPSILTRQRYVQHLFGVVLDSYTTPTTLTTVLQDWRKGRRAEIEELNGFVVAKGSGRVDMPKNTRVLEMARAIELGDLPAHVGNVERLLTASEVG